MLISEPEAILNNEFTKSATNLFDNIYPINMQTDISHVDFGRTRHLGFLTCFYLLKCNYTSILQHLIPHKTGNFILVLRYINPLLSL